MIRRLRRRLYSALRRAGALDALADSRWRARRLLILCYHGVSLRDEHEWNNQLYISAEVFRARLEMLERGRYNVLPLGGALTRLAGGTLPSRSVAITFDDGAHDFYARALPLLREYGYPATVYLTTYYCEFQRPVFDTAVSYLLWRGLVRAGGAGREGPSVEARSAKAEALRAREDANRAGLSAVQKDDLLRQMAGGLGLDYDAIFAGRALHLMTPDEVREIAAAGVDVQLHTHRHRTPGDRAAFLAEIEDNRASLERVLGPARRTHFCYPSGVHEPRFVRWLRETDITSATTCDFRLATPTDDPLLLPRLVDTGNITPIEFEACLSGVADLLPHRRHARAPAVVHSRTLCQNSGT